MRRDWKLIRAIVREEDTSAWPQSVVLGHKALCVEAGYVRAHVLRTVSSDHVQVIQYEQPWQTVEGLRVAEILANASDLDAVLHELDTKEIGHVSDFVLGLMQRKARLRFSDENCSPLHSQRLDTTVNHPGRITIGPVDERRA